LERQLIYFSTKKIHFLQKENIGLAKKINIFKASSKTGLMELNIYLINYHNDKLNQKFYLQNKIIS